MMYCPYCSGSNLTPIYAADGITIRYYRCAQPPDGCGSIVRNPIILDSTKQQPETL